MSSISHRGYINLPLKASLADARMLAVHSATGHNLQPIGITNLQNHYREYFHDTLLYHM